MKYYKTSKFTKSIASTGFIAIIACVLIAAGAITWFALSNKNNAVTKTPSKENSSINSYPHTDNSYNSSAEIPNSEPEQPSADVNDSLSDVPYSTQEPEEEPKIEAPAFILPVTGNISKGYSDSALQYSATYGDMRLHTGVDILCEIGCEIKSAGSGTVKSITDDANFGKTVTIEHSNGITAKYCGMDSVSFNEGDTVSAGDVIGTLGEIPCECADNPHIHIETVIDGKPTSPLSAFGLE